MTNRRTRADQERKLIRATARTGQPLEAETMIHLIQWTNTMDEQRQSRMTYNAGIADDTMHALYNR